jgi:SAM-dependent methyltransferase
MAITKENASFLCEAKRSGVSFRSLVTLGRQHLYLGRRRLDAIARETGIDLTRARATRDVYADNFLRLFLGVEELRAIDNSNFDGAQILHDMNTPLPGSMEETVDAVLEGGTLEHIFNFPIAIASCMRILRVGGTLFLGVPANNQLGHGFYQFSPELFYRSLSAHTGFEVVRLLALEMKAFGGEFGAHGHLYSVKDPQTVGGRVTLANSRPVFLMIQARKTRHLADPFARPPQQGDYVRAWKSAEGEAGPGVVDPRSAGRLALRRFARALPDPIRNALIPPIISEYGRWFVHTLRNRRFYTPVRSRR